MRINPEVALDFSDVLIQPKRSTLTSRSEVEIHRTFTFRNSGATHTGIPIIAANMDQVATFEFAKALANHDLATALHKHYSETEYAEFFYRELIRSDRRSMVFLTIGIADKELERLDSLANDGLIRFVCVDNANGYTDKFYKTIEKIRNRHPRITIMAGNVVSPEMTEQLIISGADIVKVGIGSGSVCTTRKITGVGLPQLTATIECADAAHGLGGHICSDGGMTVPGDIVKAFAGGADFVMLGGMFAGHRETGLPIISTTDGDFMEFYGMSSRSAMEKHANGVAKYRASEGKRVLIPVKGSIDDTLQDILGGIRSACTYVGADKLKHLSKRTTFRIVNNQLNTVFGNG